MDWQIGRASKIRAVWAIPLVGFLVLVIRHWDSIVHPQFIYEDAAAFWAATFEDQGAELLLRPWAGFLRVSQRLVFLGLRLGPTPIAPAVGELILFLAIALVAAFIVSRRMRVAIPSDRTRALVAAFLFVIPATTEMLGSVLNIEWFLWLFLLCLCLASPPRGVAAKAEVVLAVVVGLTGPIVIALLPVLAWRQWRTRPLLVVALAVCAVAQMIVYLTSGRRPAASSGIAESVYAVLRQTGTSVIGVRVGNVIDSFAFPWLLAFVGLMVLIAIALSARGLPRPTAIAFITAASLAGIAGLISVGAPSLQTPGQNARYFILAAILAAVAAATALDEHRLVGYALAAALAVGCVGDFIVDPLPQGSWSTDYGCVGAPDPCRLEVYPTAWSIDWPGLHQGFRIPSGFTPDGRPAY